LNAVVDDEDGVEATAGSIFLKGKGGRQRARCKDGGHEELLTDT
jgi:hypothetical protein